MLTSLPLVCLHGWGADNRVWLPLRAALQDKVEIVALDLPGFGSNATAFTSLDAACDALAAQLPAQCDVLGWSLGGLLAWHLAARYPQQVRSVITLGSNPCFVASGNWPGMAPEKYAQFCAGFAQDSALTRKRFLQLQVRGEPDANIAMSSLLAAMPEQTADTDSWQHALTALQSDARVLLPTLTVPVLHLLAEGDVLAPLALAQSLTVLVPQHAVQVLAQCGHAAHITQPVKVAAAVADFLSRVPYAIQQARIARSFDRAAALYQQHAVVQRDIAALLVQQLQQVQLPAQAVVLDAGCGTGTVTELLLASSAALHITGVDIAPGMLQQAAAKNLPRTAWQQADLHALPLPDNSFDVVVSNLALQWCAQPTQVFSEWRRVLRPSCGVYFSTLLPGTLHELQQAWREVDDAVHVNRFSSVAQITEQFADAGFSAISCTQHTIVRRHAALRELLAELKAIGAHNMNNGRPRGLMGKLRWKKFVQAYDAQRDAHHLLPLTYQVLIVHAAI